MTRLLGVFGSSGFAREVMPLVASQALFGDRIVFVDREERPVVNGYQVIDEASYFSWGGERRYVIAISDGNTRRRLDYPSLVMAIRSLGMELILVLGR